jgi:2,3-bisphosphoglycerate-dependent phosphoglycerate mutase
MQTTFGKLIIARHHESDWNKLGLWTGIRDSHLTEYGFSKSREMGLLLSDVKIDRAYASMQVRTIETLSSMLDALELYKVPTEHSVSLGERDYGDYTGKNKWDMKALIGEEAWDRVRREWDCPIPNGETLKMVYERVVPYYTEIILPHLLKGENVLMVSHGNAIRALCKYIEKIPDDQVKNIEMLFGGILIYDIDELGQCVSKEIRQVATDVPVHA